MRLESTNLNALAMHNCVQGGPCDEVLLPICISILFDYFQNAVNHHHVMTFERKLEKSKQKKVDFEKSSSEVLEQLKAIEEKRKSKQEKFDNVKNEMNKLHKV